MVDMGAEVGQKMRSAIRAKLTELDCYVDDELPDYIMVMVANKRTKTQMNEDLALFLKKKTTTFVDWLHIVLKKLKEVTVTNLDVYKKAGKRKNSMSDSKSHQKKIKKESLKYCDETAVKEETGNISNKSLTDDLPLNVNVKSLASFLPDNRKIVLVGDFSQSNNDKSFNTPLSSEVQNSSVKQLEEIETQIRNVKDRLGLKIDDEMEESELRKIVENSMKKTKVVDTHIKENNLALQIPSNDVNSDKLVLQNSNDKEDQTIIVKKEHSKIVFSEEVFSSPSKSPRKKSVLDRLGTYEDKSKKSVMSRLGNYTRVEKKEELYWRNKTFTRINHETTEEHKSHNRERTNKYVEGKNGESSSDNVKYPRNHIGGSVSARKDIKKRLGLSSKVTIPKINPELVEDTFKKREVVSVVKVKPRILPPNVQQANKNLLLKAVADAQKSIAQSKSVGKESKMDVENNSDLRLDHRHQVPAYIKQKKISQEGREKLNQFLSSQNEESSDQEYVPAPIKKPEANMEYVPSSLDNDSEGYENIEKKPKFVVTLDGIQRSNLVLKLSVKDRLQNRKTPSPIVFNAPGPQNKTERKIPDELPTVSIPYHKKEKCKYFPLCKNEATCEYFHPVKICEQFPYCKFGDECLFIHPNCKFGTSCTKRDCPYVHTRHGARISIAAVPTKTYVAKNQICKFFPQCMNVNCIFYHPKPCKYGNYCKNQSVCTYLHTNVPNRNILSWKAKLNDK